MHPWQREMVGSWEEHWFESDLLRDNPLADPARRPLWVYLPPGYDDDTSHRYPVLYQLQGLTGQLDMWKNRLPFRPTVPELIDELFASGEVPACIVVMVDCWTRYGGSQFLDSPGTGRYHSYLCDEIVPWVDARFRTLAQREHRGIAGKSSGGYGAMVTPMLRPDLFSGFATHAGDALFEACYLPAFRESVRLLGTRFEGSFTHFWEKLGRGPALDKPEEGVLMNDWCMAACYSADADGTVRLPYDLETGELVPEIWERWLRWDPVRMARANGDVLRGMRAVWIDAGERDEYFLDLGALAFARELRRAGVSDFQFELFDATHRAIEYRYPMALGFLAERLA
jgi:hypothetical protein